MLVLFTIWCPFSFIVFSQRHTFPTGSVKIPMEFLRKILGRSFSCWFVGENFVVEKFLPVSSRSLVSENFLPVVRWNPVVEEFYAHSFFAADPPCYDFAFVGSKSCWGKTLVTTCRIYIRRSPFQPTDWVFPEMVSQSNSLNYVCTLIHAVSHFLHLLHSFI